MKFEQRVRQWWLPLIRAKWFLIRMRVILLLTRKRVMWTTGILVTLLAFVLIVFGGYAFEWQWTGFRGQRFWNWLELLVVPIVLAVGGYLFTRAESRATQQATERRAQDEAVQAYLDYMGELLLEKNLRTSKDDDEVRTLARARTLTTLKRLDAEHNKTVLNFLKDSGLFDEYGDSIIKFGGALLISVDLEQADLTRVELEHAMLAGANLRFCNLRGAVLRDAYLSHADLRYANLVDADLSGAKLRAADLRHANLRKANLGLGKRFPAAADLRRANLKGVNLEDANLSGADLRGAKVVTEQLHNCKSLADATMPNGQKHEDWLKGKGRGEDGENSGP